MATLNTLPYETLTQILSGLSNTDLAHISCVSSRLCAVAEPLLYRAPCLSETKRPSLAIFLQTLLLPGRESLATNVNSLRVDWHGGWWGQDSLDTPRQPHSPESHGTGLVRLLHLLSSLQVLEIVPSNASSDFTRLLESYNDGQLSTLPLGLQSLREFRCSPASLCGLRISTIWTLLRLPCIRSISTPINSENSHIMPVAAHPAPGSSITDLRLSNGLRISSLRYLLNDLTSLTHFSYRAFVLYNYDLQAFMRALEPLRNTLQHLHLDFMTEKGPHIDDGLTFVGGSLQTWPVLQTLSCGLMPLLGKRDEVGTLRLVDVLPPSLRELEILKDHYWTYREAMIQAVELVGQMETVVPKLECLVVVRCWDSHRGLEERLARLCEDAGVRYGDDCCSLAM